MTFVINSLASGLLPSTTGVLYTVPADTKAIIKAITYVEGGDVDCLVNLYIRQSGGALRSIIPKDMPLNAHYSMETDSVFTLSPGDTIEGDSNIADDVEYTVNGVEKT